MASSKVVDSALIMFSSSSILTVTTVLVMDIANARKIESKKDNCSA
jgi:hypothetical protein